jgi:hypothetical protein
MGSYPSANSEICDAVSLRALAVRDRRMRPSDLLLHTATEAPSFDSRYFPPPHFCWKRTLRRENEAQAATSAQAVARKNDRRPERVLVSNAEDASHSYSLAACGQPTTGRA